MVDLNQQIPHPQGGTMRLRDLPRWWWGHPDFSKHINWGTPAGFQHEPMHEAVTHELQIIEQAGE